MPIYTFRCPACGSIEETIMGMNDEHILACSCGFSMDRIWDVPRLGGDLPACGVDYNHFDAVSGRYITTKSEWDAAKRDTGRIDYVPDPVLEKGNDEAKYIAEHSKPGDREADRAGHKVMREAHQKKTAERTEKVSQAAKKEVLKELRSYDF